jgi:uncharacterized protein
MAVLNFPDVNVWLALVWSHHVHSERAREWFEGRFDDQFFFCRVTQVSLLRLLTTAGVMGEDLLSMSEAWKIHDRLFDDSRIQFMTEPSDLGRRFRTMSAGSRSSPKVWSDAYLAAFAESAGLQLVSFDRAF